MAVSDVLRDAEAEILDYQRDGVIATDGEPELELLTDLMRAVRSLPGRDAPPDAPNTFAADLARALAAYDHACQRRQED
jgi:hypothetical protein